MSSDVYVESIEMATRSFPDIIRRAIAADGRTLYRLAIDCGVDVAVLQRFVSGERGMTLTTAEKVCKAVGLTLAADGKAR